MNTVEIKGQQKIKSVKPGDLFIDKGTSKIYLLTVYVDEINKRMFVAVGLIDGENWDFPNSDILEAVIELDFYGSDVKIIIEKK